MSAGHGLEPQSDTSTTPQAPEGWYPDPEHPDQLRRWTGMAWDDPPLRPRHVPADVDEPATTTSESGGHGTPVLWWYLLAVLVPMVLVVLVPGWWADSHLEFGLLPRPLASADYLAGAPQHVVELRGQTQTIGWALVGVTALGAFVGFLLFGKARGEGDQVAVAANRVAWAAVACTIMLAIVLSMMVNVLVFEPYPHGGVVGIGL